MDDQPTTREHMRLFFAVELPPRVQQILGGIKPQDDNRDYRWVDPGLLHLTLAFLGEQPAARLDVLQRVGRAAASHSRPALLRLGEAGSFGAKRGPRVLWVGLTGDLGALEALHGKLANGLREAGFTLEDRPFRPHITLARRRESAAGGAPTGWPPQLAKAQAGFEMQHLTLFESRLSPRGATYVPVFKFSVDDH
jgi:2'-5' RNA ligase